MRTGLLIGLLGLSLVLPGRMQGQVASATNASPAHLWVGAEYSNFNPDWGIIRLPGVTAFVDISMFRRFGLEGEARFLNFTKPDGLAEKSYLGGPFYRALRWHRITGTAKVLIGAGVVDFTTGVVYPGTNYTVVGSYFAYAPGGTVEYRLAHRLKARVDYEYEFLPSAPGLPASYGIPNHGLTPNGFSAGLSYLVR